MNRWLLRGVIAGIVVMTIGTGGYIKFKKELNPFPETVRKTTSYPLYYPSKLSEDFQLDQDSFRVVEDNIILFQLKHTSGDVINVSLQPKPKDFDFEEFYRESVKETESHFTTSGKATYGNINRGCIISIETEQTWILVNSLANLSKEQQKLIADSFTKIN